MLLLVRHGESMANSGRITTDFATIELTSKGRAQAAAVATACPGRPDQVVLSSYLRARQTSEPLLEKYPGVKVFESQVHEFTYLSRDRCNDTDIVRRQPMVDAYWNRMDPNYRDGIGAESFVDLLQRTKLFLAEVQGWTGLSVVFTHEQFIRSMVLASFYNGGSDSAQMRRFFAMRTGLPIPNGGIVHLDYRVGRWWIGGIDDSHVREIT